MRYVDGFVAAVPTENLDRYIAHAEAAAVVFKDHGATRVVECWGDDVPEGEVTSFSKAVQKQDDETVVFSWVERRSSSTCMSLMQTKCSSERSTREPQKSIRSPIRSTGTAPAVCGTRLGIIGSSPLVYGRCPKRRWWRHSTRCLEPTEPNHLPFGKAWCLGRPIAHNPLSLDTRAPRSYDTVRCGLHGHATPVFRVARR